MRINKKGLSILRTLLWIMSIVAFMCLLVLIAGNIPSADPQPRVNKDITVRIVAANLCASNSRPLDTGRYLSQLDADLFFLFEWTGTNVDLTSLYRAGVRSLLEYPRGGTHGVCVLSKQTLGAHPFLITNTVARKCAIPLVIVRIKIKTGWLNILGVHAPPPIRSCGTENTKTLAEVAKWIDAGRLIKRIGPVPPGDPVIVAGDLNAHPFSASIRNLRNRGLVEVGSATRWRPVFTWAPTRWLPYIAKLDYVLVGPDLKVNSSWVLELPGSDHRLVMAEITL